MKRYCPDKVEPLFFNDKPGQVLTIGELKETLKSYPDDGEVWFMNSFACSSPVRQILPLNKRQDTCDIVFDSWTEDELTNPHT